MVRTGQVLVSMAFDDIVPRRNDARSALGRARITMASWIVTLYAGARGAGDAYGVEFAGPQRLLSLGRYMYWNPQNTCTLR